MALCDLLSYRPRRERCEDKVQDGRTAPWLFGNICGLFKEHFDDLVLAATRVGVASGRCNSPER